MKSKLLSLFLLLSLSIASSIIFSIDNGDMDGTALYDEEFSPEGDEGMFYIEEEMPEEMDEEDMTDEEDMIDEEEEF